MKIKYILTVVILGFFFVSASHGAVYHKYLMKGSVLEVTDGMAYICVGTSDGAKVGQELNVVRYVKMEATPGQKGGSRYTREEVGKIKIEKIVDEHMADAKILSGNVKVHDIVELMK